MKQLLKTVVTAINSWFSTLVGSGNASTPKTTIMRIIDVPNTNSKPRNKEVNGIIIHSMGEYIGEQYSAKFLQEIGLSAHYLVEPDGTILKCVEPDRMAFHAGESEWNGQRYLNTTYIGIELLVSGKHDWRSFLEAIKKPETYTDEQYEQCALLCAQLMRDFPGIDPDNIVRHSEVSGPDVRPDDPKPDPGEGFSMTRLKSKIYRNINKPENS